MLVGVVDTGIDAGHPEFAGKIAASRSFVGGSVDDEIGHGTFVAGEIAAALGNGQGIAGIAFPAQLIVAKVIGSDGTIDPSVEAKAIRWEVDRGAQVINLSIGALRDPADPNLDTYSPVEAAAVRYATSHGVLVVAAVGNGDDAPSTPWPYASYPAALPHVLGVGALAQDGNIPAFSNRDAIYTDLVAPGVGVLSTFPRSLTAQRPACADQGYSDCASRDYRDGRGNVVRRPSGDRGGGAPARGLPRPDGRPADDDHRALCRRRLAGHGLLRTASSAATRARAGEASTSPRRSATLSGTLPRRDELEPNDDAGSQARKVWGNASFVRATADYWDDPVDVYAVRLRAGERLSVALRGPGLRGLQLVLWKPGTAHVDGKPGLLKSHRLFQSRHVGAVSEPRLPARLSQAGTTSRCT